MKLLASLVLARPLSDRSSMQTPFVVAVGCHESDSLLVFDVLLDQRTPYIHTAEAGGFTANFGNPENRLTFFQGAGIVTLLFNNLTGMLEDSLLLCIALPRTGIGRPAGLRFHSLAAPRRVR